MNKEDRKAIINALAKQIRLVEQQGNLDQAEKLKNVLEYQLELEQFSNLMASLDHAELAKLEQAELAHAQTQLKTADSQNDTEAASYWQHVIAKLSAKQTSR